MNKFSVDSFSAFKFEDKPVFDRIMSGENKSICEFNFPNLYIWAEIFGLKWAVSGETLLIYNVIDDFIYMPAGKKTTPEEMAGISDGFREQGKSGNYIFADADFVEANKELERYFRLEIDRDNADYIYSTKKLVEMKGKKLHKKKNLVSQFTRNNPGHEVKKLEKGSFSECFKLSEKWCRDRNCDEIGFSHETSALKLVFEKFGGLGMEGLVIFAGKQMAAFSIFSMLNKNTADVHFEKYDAGIKGSEQAICWETAKYLLGKAEYINREEDLGLEGLRQSKLSYDPDRIETTYKLYRL